MRLQGRDRYLFYVASVRILAQARKRFRREHKAINSRGIKRVLHTDIRNTKVNSRSAAALWTTMMKASPLKAKSL